jgi:endonuclease/exonuclease/phosphatase (EEP) superfamily protein YafD
MLRVLTVNLYNGAASAEALGRILDDVQPDVMAAQELDPGAARVISSRLPHGTVAPATDHSGIALASRTPLEVRRQHLPHRDALVGRTDSMTIWCVHLANPVDLPPRTRARRAQVREIGRHLNDSTGPLLLVGDLNATPVWPAYRRLTQHLDDGVAEWARRNGKRPSRTWSYRAWFPPVLRIDHALVRDLKVHDTFTVEVPGSDHQALVVDVG